MDIAQGESDLTKRIAVKGKDELGELSNWFNMFLERLNKLVLEIKGKCLQYFEFYLQHSARSRRFIEQDPSTKHFFGRNSGFHGRDQQYCPKHGQGNQTGP